MSTLLQTAKEKDFAMRNRGLVAERYSTLTKQDDLLSPKNLTWDEYFWNDLEVNVYEAIQPYSDGYMRFVTRDLKKAKETGKGMKSAVNALMTVINQKTWELNARDIAWRCDYAESTGQKYAVRFYLLHYKRINSLMKRVMLDYIRSI